MAVDNILIDTNAYASFKRGDIAAIEIIRSSPFIGINSTVLGELLSGFVVGNRESFNRTEHSRVIAGSDPDKFLFLQKILPESGAEKALAEFRGHHT